MRARREARTFTCGGVATEGRPRGVREPRGGREEVGEGVDGGRWRGRKDLRVLRMELRSEEEDSRREEREKGVFMRGRRGRTPSLSHSQ